MIFSIILFIAFIIFCFVNIIAVMKGLFTYRKHVSTSSIVRHLRYIECLLWVIILMIGIYIFV